MRGAFDITQYCGNALNLDAKFKHSLFGTCPQSTETKQLILNQLPQPSKSPGINQVPAELIKAGGRILQSEIHKLIISIWNKQELPEEWKASVIVPI
jgi:hypothetical protein